MSTWERAIDRAPWTLGELWDRVWRGPVGLPDRWWVSWATIAVAGAAWVWLIGAVLGVRA